MEARSALAQAVRKARKHPPPGAGIDERRAYGRGCRNALTRADQGNWKPKADRPNPVVLIQEANAERLPHLVPLKMARMAASPFGFFRGAAQVMARDLAHLPTTGITVQICGDAHVRNLGAFAAPDGHLVFDINDFDETLPGPWEWDLKRLATSFVLAGREAGERDDVCLRAVRKLVQTYREAVDRFGCMPALNLARLEVTHDVRLGPVNSVLAKAERASPLHTLERLTVRARKGWPRFHNSPPLLRHVPERFAKKILESLVPYRATLGPDRQTVLDAYKPVDVTFKVVGTGSVGTRDYALLFFGVGPEDPLILQVKEELPSCYARYLDHPPFPHQGRRVAEGQHRMQTVSDPFLGWTAIEGRDFLVRQLADHKATVDPSKLRGEALISYARVTGQIFAKAHARTGDGVAIAGYAGKSSRLDKALANFALAYADQTGEDHAHFVEAIKAGQIKASKSPFPGRPARPIARKR
jgi:uncharacterized protein (DUF2252 family)